MNLPQRYVWESWPCHSPPLWWYRQGRNTPTRLPLTTCSRWETWSWGHEIMRAAPTPHQRQHSGEQALHSRADPDGKGVGKPNPKGARMGELVLPLVCHALTWMKERCPLSLATYGRQRSWPYPLPTAALGRASPAPCLGSTLELDLEVGLPVSQPPGHELKRQACLVCCAVAPTKKRCPLPLPCPSPPMARERVGHRVMRMGEWTLDLNWAAR